MGLKKRISRLRESLSGRPRTGAERKPRTGAEGAPRTGAERKPRGAAARKPQTAATRRPRTAAADARRATGAVVGVAAELLKLGREMLVIPAQLWLAIAEIVGIAVLFAWRRVAFPLLLALLALSRAAYRLALRHVTPARAVAAVCLAALVALAASQWVDYRGISVGTDAYSGELEAVAPAPDVDRERAGEAHAWAMLPLALAGAVVLVLALAGRPRAAWLLIALGIATIAIAVAIDAPQGLDEGTAALAYQGAEARLLEGFWVQIAAGAVLIASGLLLPRYLRPAPVGARAATPADRGPGGVRRLLPRAPRRLRREQRPRSGGGDEARIKGETGVGARTWPT
jgi:hypothetical protein